MALFDSLGTFGQVAFGLVSFLGITLVIAALVGVYLWWRSLKKYNVPVLIRIAGSHRYIRDMGGVFVNRRTKALKFHLRYAKKSFNPDLITYLEGPKGALMTEFIKDTESGLRPMKVYFKSGHLHTTVSEEDVNWGLEAYNSFQKAFKIDLMALLSFGLMAFVSLLILVMIIILMRQVPEIASTMKEAASALVQATSNLNQQAVIG